jgi:hypothetical protein
LIFREFDIVKFGVWRSAAVGVQSFGNLSFGGWLLLQHSALGRLALGRSTLGRSAHCRGTAIKPQALFTRHF